MKYAVMAFLFLLPAALALNIHLTPDVDTERSIANINCGSVLSVIPSQVTIKNNGDAGVLCWYSTSEDAAKKKLTGSCIRANDTPSYSFPLKMPFDGKKHVEIRLECFDFYDLEKKKDTCDNSFDYNYAVNNKYTCANADGEGCLGHILPILSFNLSCDKISFNLTVDNDTFSLYNGQSAEATINLTNDMNHTLQCDQAIGSVAVNGSVFKKLTITAPSNGTSSISKTFAVSCTWDGGSILSKTVTVTAVYKEDPCVFGMAPASNNVSAALFSLASAKDKIAAEKNTSSIGLLNDGYDHYYNAKSALWNAEAACDKKDRESAVSYMNLAINESKEAVRIASAILTGTQQNQTANLTNNTINQTANQTRSRTVINVTEFAPAIGQETLIAAGVIAAICGIVIVIIASGKKKGPCQVLTFVSERYAIL